jgi:lysophospholipase L1-like esterase
MAERPAASLQRLGRWYQGTAILILNTLLLLLLVEGAAGLVLRLIQTNFSPADARSELAYYRDQAWGRAYWQEFSAVSRRFYEPYVTWRRGPFDGETINIDDEGLRQTPGAVCTEDAYTVFAFGGSTMWGTGSPDGSTIPAYLQRGLAGQQERPVCVVNFGELAYVSTQSLIRLERQLQSGQVPDLVIFYDGINDVYAAYQSGQAGVHQNLDEVRAVFERQERPFSLWLGSTNTVRLLNRVLSGINSEQPVGSTYKTMGVAAAPLASSIVQVYGQNVRMVDALAQKYGFATLFFWQPVIAIGDKALTEDEEALRSEMDPDLVTLFELTYEQVKERAATEPNLYDIADVLDEETGGVWIDSWHVTPVGNEQIAQVMLQVIEAQ